MTGAGSGIVMSDRPSDTRRLRQRRVTIRLAMDETLQAVIGALKALSALSTGLAVLGFLGRLLLLISRWLGR
jgi:hypothetical protein